MNRQELRDEINRYGFGDIEYPNSVVEAEINSVYSEIQQGGDLTFLESGPEEIVVAAGNNTEVSETYLPEDYSKAIALTYGNIKLKELDPRTFIQVQLTDQEVSEPEYYTVYNTNRLLIWPAPEAETTFKLWYEKTLDPLEENTDEPQIPERYHYLIVWGVLSKLYLATDEEDKFQAVYEGRYQSMLEMLRADLSDNNLDVSEVIGNSYNVAAIHKMVIESGFTENSIDTTLLMANQAVAELSAIYNWRYLENDPAEIEIEKDSNYTLLPEDCSKPKRVVILNNSGEGKALTHISSDQLIDKTNYHYSQDKGEPTQYAVYGADENNIPKIRLYPKPDQDYDALVWYTRNPVKMENITDVPPFPEKYHRIVLLGVLIQCATMNYSMSEENNTAAKLQAYKTEYEELKQIVFSDDQRVAFDKNVQIENTLPELYGDGF